MILSQICDELIIPSQVCDELIIPSQVCDGITIRLQFCDRFETDAINKNYCIIYFFYIFINIKIFKKKPVKEAKIDSTTYRISL